MKKLPYLFLILGLTHSNVSAGGGYSKQIKEERIKTEICRLETLRKVLSEIKSCLDFDPCFNISPRTLQERQTNHEKLTALANLARVLKEEKIE